MQFFSICSDPNEGNSYLVETKKHRFLLDAGFTNKALEEACLIYNINPQQIDSVFLTHAHLCQTKGLHFLIRKNPKIQVFGSQKTLGSIQEKIEVPNARTLDARALFTNRNLSIYSFPVKHTVETYNFVFYEKNERLAYITNTGNLDIRLIEDIGKVENFIIEAYYHPGMIRSDTDYRHISDVVSNRGHLTNEDASEIVARCKSPDIKNILISNLSKYNNSNLALLAMRSVFEEPEQIHIQIAPRKGVSEKMK